MQPVIFGEVLFDCFDNGSRILGGAPFNVAWHLAALGQQPLMLSCIGIDAEGAEILQRMTDWQMDQRGIQQSATLPTGRVQVQIRNREPHYDIVRPAAWDGIAADALPAISDAAFIYHGTLALRDAVSAAAFTHLQASTRAPLFMDVNLRDPWWDPAQVLHWMAQATWIKLNRDELRRLVPDATTEPACIERLLALPQLRYLLLTKGEAGADLFAADGQHWRVAPTANDIGFVDAVGAGDAFTSIFLLGTLLDWAPALTLRRAQDFASAVVGIRGATTTDRTFYQAFRKAWSV